MISASQSSSCEAGRALSAGIEPTTPALHCSITSFGLLTMNIGEQMTGSGMRKASDCSVIDIANPLEGTVRRAGGEMPLFSMPARPASSA